MPDNGNSLLFCHSRQDPTQPVNPSTRLTIANIAQNHSFALTLARPCNADAINFSLGPRTQ